MTTKDYIGGTSQITKPLINELRLLRKAHKDVKGKYGQFHDLKASM